MNFACADGIIEGVLLKLLVARADEFRLPYNTLETPYDWEIRMG